MGKRNVGLPVTAVVIMNYVTIHLQYSYICERLTVKNSDEKVRFAI